ncbi:cell shape determination protein CcmA [Acidihalobacter yilgarnensis]|uniref:Cell shape determination protein CcmA n=1 Tax=Acidihalobacter yilgarnensis TaxID=2819280 RepID=A0A1D8IL75_9GAMM|nr:polymer-forming cytoskeletal protein [Acidihalobacter yilgarnensis]AOU97217.1 cell shape determination protein CcmA [Acidihalobacter yilgarnensis]
MWGGKKKFNAVRVDTLIGKGTVITGGVSFIGGLHVDGRVQGNVTAGDTSGTMLVLSENGAIEGEVHAPNIVLNGVVDGDVHSSEHLELATNAKIRGDVYYNLLEMAVGAEVNGNLVHRKGGKLQLEDRREDQEQADTTTDS